MVRKPLGRSSDLAENEAGYLSYRQSRWLLRRTAQLPLGALGVLLAGTAVLWTGFAEGVVFPFEYGSVILVVLAFAGYLFAAWWPVVADVMAGRVATVEGELRKSSTLGIFRRIHYCHVANTSFQVPAALFHALKPGPCRCHFAPRTRRLLTVQPLDPGHPE